MAGPEPAAPDAALGVLRASDAMLRAALDSQLDPFVVLSPVRDAAATVVDLRHVWANAAALAYHGLTAEQFVGTTMLGLFPGLQRHGPLDHYLRTATTGEPTVLDDYPYDNEVLGQSRYYDLRAARVGEDVTLTWRDVTERVVASREHEAAEARYRLLVEHGSDVVYQSDGRHRFVWLSPSVTAMLGWEPDELTGRSPADLLHPDDRTRMPALVARVDAGESVLHEERFRTKDGQYRWLAVMSRAVVGEDGAVTGYVGSWRDVTDEVAAREAQRASESLLRRAMDSAATGMALTDLDGRFLLVNPALGELVARTEAWLLRHGVADILADDVRASVVSMRDDLLAGRGGRAVAPLRLVRSDGEDVWVRVAAATVPGADGAPASFVIQVEDVTGEHEARELLAYSAFHDALTGLRNRAWILDILDVDLRAAKRRGSTVGVLFADVDNVKVVNDSLGHAAGDEVIAVVGDRIAGALGTGPRVGRFGGDEFVVVLPDVAEPQDVERVAEAISEAVASELLVLGHRVVPTVSIGIALSTGAATAESLIRDADSALVRAKRGGRARWHFADERMHDQAVARLTVEDELREALARGDIVVHYQPVVDLGTGEVCSHEALVRWAHPGRGLLAPGAFLEVAEDSGLVVDLGHQVLDEVCARLASTPWLHRVSVNYSGVQLAHRDWRRRVEEALERHAVAPERLVLEVTETAALSLLDSTRRDFADLREAGVGLHVDDFGTGYSSISLLSDLPVTGVKLDMKFVRDLTPGRSKANALAAGLAGLVRELDLNGVAEGIETEEQAGILRAQGWAFGQGYLYARPGPEPRRAL